MSGLLYKNMNYLKMILIVRYKRYKKGFYNIHTPRYSKKKPTNNIKNNNKLK